MAERERWGSPSRSTARRRHRPLVCVCKTPCRCGRTIPGHTQVVLRIDGDELDAFGCGFGVGALAQGDKEGVVLGAGDQGDSDLIIVKRHDLFGGPELTSGNR